MAKKKLNKLQRKENRNCMNYYIPIVMTVFPLLQGIQVVVLHMA